MSFQDMVKNGNTDYSKIKESVNIGGKKTSLSNSVNQKISDMRMRSTLKMNDKSDMETLAVRKS